MNAHYMPVEMFRQLVLNLKEDGCLTSSPLVYCPESRPPGSCEWPDGTVMSGNHRLEAALEAGLEEADCIEIIEPISHDRAVAIQLAHNGIFGKDDPNILASLYGGLPFELKRYSGLDDSILKGMEPIDINSLGVSAPKYEELTILFLPEQEAAFKEALSKIEKRAKKGETVYVAKLTDFDRFFEAIVAVKRFAGVYNNAIALNKMAELALEACKNAADGESAQEAEQAAQ